LGLGSAQAAGLGKLTVVSGLGEPLRAEIELTSVGKDEIATLAAHLAPSDAYSKSNIEYTSSLSTLRFTVAQHPNGTQYLAITSVGPINEPFLDMLIQLDWASGRLVREYTLLLDPPEVRPGQTAAAAPVLPVTSSPLAASPRRGGSPGAVLSPSVGASGTGTRTGTATSGGSAGGTYEVKRGDTAARIARENKPDGVTLEQVLIALLRSNPSAFEGSNVNRLHTGAVLQLPDAAAAKGVDSSEAQRLVSAQAADFASYRARLGTVAATAPIEEKPSTQAASGKVTAKVDEKQAKTVDPSDTLKLSKPGDKGGGAAAAGTKASSGPSAEDLAVKERALKEADERVKLLEKNVSDLQKLLDLKNQNLAQLQKQLDATQAKAADARTAQAKAAAIAPIAAPVAVATPPAPPPPVPAPAPVPQAPPAAVSKPVTPPVAPPSPAPTPAPEAAAPLAKIETKPDTPIAPPPSASTTSSPTATDASTPPAAPPPAPPKKPVVKVNPPPPPPGGGILDDLMDNLPYVGGGIAVILALLGYGVYNQRRKKKFSKFEDSILTGASGLRANSVFGTTGGQSVDTANSAFNSNFVPMSGQMDTNEVDPVAEADVYIAYGRDAQAEEILKEALRAQPERHAVRLKLLEIYAKRQDAKAFETIASELYAQTGGVGEEWQRAATLGASFDSANPLYRDAHAGSAAGPEASAPHAAPASAGAAASYMKTQPLSAQTMAGIAAASGAGIATALAQAAPRAEAAGSAFPNTLPMEPILDLDLTKTEPISGSQSPAEPVLPPAMDLDFDLGFGDKPAEVPSLTRSEAESVATAGRAAAANNLDFDLDLSGTPEAPQAILADGLEKTVAINAPGLTESLAAPQNFEATVPIASKPFVPVAPPETAAGPVRDADNVDFSLDLPPASEHVPELPTTSNFEKTQPFDNSFAGITLDLDQGGVMHVAGEQPPQAGGGKWQDMATKLDLAVAYRDIGDKDGARELLEEVMKEGDAAQIDKAKELMSALA
jgi:pilus assembly protein FimV